MNKNENNLFSGPVTIFQEKRLPEPAIPAGYAALIQAYNLQVPLPRLLYAIGEKHKMITKDGWQLLTPRHAPSPTLEGHLFFALKHEGLDLAVLKRLFLQVGPSPIEAIVRAQPTSSYARRLWFLYEWLLGHDLDLPRAEQGNYVDALDENLQFGIQGQLSPRHRVKNNLPGTPLFCPLVFRTKTLETFISLDLSQQAKDAIQEVPKSLLARTAAFLLLQDSKSSYIIEGEQPPQDRIQRWARALAEAQDQPIDLTELLRLQRIVIGDVRFVHLGLRQEGGFVGDHDRSTRMPLPDHISARPQDLPSLIQGMVEFDMKQSQSLDAVIAASVLAFGFIYSHPFEDGNGRLHRYLIHHMLARRGFNPPGLIFPISAAILDRIEDYKLVLEDYSKRLLPVITWEPTQNGNVDVLNDTADFYRYFDATPQTEFLYSCVQKTIEEDLPQETEFLRRYDQFCANVQSIVDMPHQTTDLLFKFLQQQQGKLSKRAQEKEFAQLTPDEIQQIENLYRLIF